MHSPNYIPPRPTGDDEEARYHQAVWDKLWGNGNQLLDTDQIKFERTTNGIRPKINIRPGSGSSGGDSGVWL